MASHNYRAGIGMASQNAALSGSLKELGWTKTYLAERLGVCRETVGRWGEYEVPGYARAYLHMAIAVKRLSALIEKGQ